MPVGDLGPEEVVTGSPDEPLGDLVDKFESENVGAVVVTEDEEPVGVVTDRDVALEVGDSEDVASVPASDVMTGDPVTLEEDAEAMELSRAIGEHDVRRIPVVDDDGHVTGIVTLDDLVATIGEQLDNVSDTIEVQSPEYTP